MAGSIYSHIDKYIRGGLGTDYEPGLEIPGVSIFQDDYLFAKKVESSSSVNANSVIGEPPMEMLNESIKAINEFYGTKPFSWIIKSSKKYAYIEKTLNSAGMKQEKTFYGMYLPLDNTTLEKIDASDLRIELAKNEKQIGEVVDLSCEIFSINISERENMIQERMSILLNPFNRSGFHLAYIDGKAVGYSRYRFSGDGVAMYLTGSGILKEFRGKHIYMAFLKERHRIAKNSGCKLLTVFAREDTSKPILEKLNFKTEGKYLFMTRSELE